MLESTATSSPCTLSLAENLRKAGKRKRKAVFSVALIDFIFSAIAAFLFICFIFLPFLNMCTNM